MTHEHDSPPSRRHWLPHPTYGLPGAYFVTLVTHHRATLFGWITQGKTELSRYGLVLTDTVRELPRFYPTVELDEHVIMPDHFHAILWIKAVEGNGKHVNLMEIVRGLKSISAPEDQPGKAFGGSAGLAAVIPRPRDSKREDVGRGTPVHPEQPAGCVDR